jgi:hypothetical protein
MNRFDLTSLLGVILLAPCLLADETPETKITFDEHIKPIFREHCTACHSESDKESDLALDSYAASMAGGSSGTVIAEGDAAGSRLFKLMTHAERPFMPPDQDPIPKPQIDLIKTWIEQGMPENSGSKIKRSNNAATAMLSTATLGKPEGPPPMPEALLRQPVFETERSSAIAAMAASPWAPLIVVGGQGQVCCYHAESGALLGVIPFPEGEPQSLTFTRDGRQLLIGGGRHSHSGCAVLVDIATGQRIAKVGDELDIVLAADISPNKKHIALAGPKKMVRIFDTATGELVFEMKKHTDWIFALRYSPDGVLLATGDRSNGLMVWEADTGRLYSELKGHTGEVRSLDFRGDSNVLASGSLDGTIKLWDMNEIKEIKSWAAHGGGVTSLAFANNGLIASAGQDARIKLWNGNGELQKEFSGLKEAALQVAVTGDASYIAGGDWNGQVQLWPATDPAQVKMIAANPPSIDRRLQQAQRAVASLQAEMAVAQQAADAATQTAAKSQMVLAAAQQSAEKVSQQLTVAAKLDQSLSTELTQLDSQVQDLEAQLAAARGQRQAVAQRSEQHKSEMAKLAQQSQVAAKTTEASQAKQVADAAAAAAAQQASQLLNARLAAAQLATEQALADKAALDARAAELNQQQQQSAATVQSLVTQVAAVEQQAAQLKRQLEEAEQAALDAQSQQRLFQESYQATAPVQ